MNNYNYLVELYEATGTEVNRHFTIVATDATAAGKTAKRLCRLLPGLWHICIIEEI